MFYSYISLHEHRRRGNVNLGACRWDGTNTHTTLYDAVRIACQALNPEVDWRAMEDAYLGNTPIELVYIDDFLSAKALAVLRDLALGSTIYFDPR